MANEQIGMDPNEPLIRVKGNHVYFYEEIVPDTAIALNHLLMELDRDRLWRQHEYGTERNVIILHINSWGGSLVDALAIFDTIQALESEVHTIIEGACMSAATLISLSGNKRFIRKNAFVMIHQTRISPEGKLTSEAIKDMENNNDFTENIIKNVYLEKTSVGEEELVELLKHDLYLNSEYCLKNGIVDEII